MIKMIVEKEIEFDRLLVSKDFKYLIEKLLEKKPTARYSAEECLRLPVLLKI
jgi:hypothetical protein